MVIAQHTTRTIFERFTDSLITDDILQIIPVLSEFMSEYDIDISSLPTFAQYPSILRMFGEYISDRLPSRSGHRITEREFQREKSRIVSELKELLPGNSKLIRALDCNIKFLAFQI